MPGRHIALPLKVMRLEPFPAFDEQMPSEPGDEKGRAEPMPGRNTVSTWVLSAIRIRP